MVAYLLTECGADPNCTAYNGSTPTSLAESSEVVKLLLQYGGVTNNSIKWLLASQYSGNGTSSTVPGLGSTRNGGEDKTTKREDGGDKTALINALGTEVKVQIKGYPCKEYKETSV